MNVSIQPSYVIEIPFTNRPRQLIGCYKYSLNILLLSLAKTVLTLFSTRVKMSAYANPFIELAPVLDATPQINSCIIKTNKNTHI